MIRSMTAFARVSRSSGKRQWILEIRSLNHRYFDLSLRLPPEFVELEGRIRDLVRAQISRGKISLSLTRAGEEQDETIELDEEAAKKYLRATRQLKKHFGLSGEVNVNELIKLPRLFTTRKAKTSLTKSWQEVKGLLSQALTKTLKAKRAEGAKIVKDVHMRLGLIRRAAEKIKKQAAGRKQACFEKMRARVQELLAKEDFDEERLLREVAILVDRSDITEELVRLESHLSLFDGRLKSTKEVGRELDFFCQELNREINTIGSKAQMFEISSEVVFVKGEIEKIREQIQNVE